MKIDKTEFEFTFSRSSGAGGQNVNKVNSKVTLIWDIESSASLQDDMKERFRQKFSRLMTNEGQVKITSQKYRSQARNIADVIEKIHGYVSQIIHPPKKRKKTKPTKASVQKRIENKKLRSLIKKNRQKVNY